MQRNSGEDKKDSMEKARKSIAIGLVLLVIINAVLANSKGTKADDVGCYPQCVILCLPYKSLLSCSTGCAVKCLDSTLNISSQEAWKDKTSDFCQIGCTISACTRLIAKENAGKSYQQTFTFLSWIYFSSPQSPTFC